MGTTFSNLPSLYGEDAESLDNAFAACLRDAVDESWVTDKASKSRQTRRYTEGILGKQSGVSFSSSADFENNETSEVTEEYSSYQRGGKQSTSRMKMYSKSGLDINRNPSRQVATESTSRNIGGEQNATQRPFKPESWPTLEMIETHLSKHNTYCSGPPTTLIFARFLPTRDSKKYVEIRYSTTENPEETILESSDKLETLITPKEEFKKGDSIEDDAKYFLLIFKTCINHLQGQVWWNGFSFTLDPNVKFRLKLSALETQPISQLLFELTGMKELQVRRTLHRMELKGQVEGSTENEAMYIRFRGISVKDIKVKQLRSNLITVHIPGFSQELTGF